MACYAQCDGLQIKGWSPGVARALLPRSGTVGGARLGEGRKQWHGGPVPVPPGGAHRNSARDRITFAARPYCRSRIIATTVAPPSWTIKDAEKLYNMSGWGLGYFRVSSEGHVTVHPDTNR
jgi:hypothetical protein